MVDDIEEYDGRSGVKASTGQMSGVGREEFGSQREERLDELV
jgi:hypothetical protein